MANVTMPSGQRRLRDSSTPPDGPTSPASSSPTSPTTGPSTRARCASRSTGRRCATRSARTPSTSCIGALDHAADVDRRRLRAAHRQRAVAARRRVGVLLGRRPAHPRQGRLQVHDVSEPGGAPGDTADTIEPGAGRTPAHPRVPAADPLHAQGGDLRRSGLGGGRRAQPARGLRPHAGERRARPLQADRRRRGQLRRRVRLGVPRPPGRPEARPRDLLPRPRVLRRRLRAHGRGQRRRCPTPSSSTWRWSGPPRSTPRARPHSGC